jgi:hypothetical protein
LSNPKQPPLPVERVTVADALSEGRVAAYLIAVTPHLMSWAIEDWFGQNLTVELADEVVATFRDALYRHIRPQG